MVTTPLTGRESSLLALLAQAPTMAAVDRERILSKLQGTALEIARAIVGLDTSIGAKETAASFLDWARRI